MKLELTEAEVSTLLVALAIANQEALNRARSSETTSDLYMKAYDDITKLITKVHES